VIVEQAMARIGSEPMEAEGGSGLAYGSGGTIRAAARRAKAEPPAITVPEWTRLPVPPEERPPRPLAPSALAIDDEAAPPPSDAMRAAAKRGILIHQLLERLAPVAPEARRDSALHWLEGSAGMDDADAREEIAAQVCAVLSDPSFAPLFGPGSLGEAPLAATLPDGRVIAGTVDRLLVEPGRVSLVDFKTGLVPQRESDIPLSHRAQMAAYTEALKVIFPGRSISAALLYTDGPQLFELAP
jgi:ATP-dependent helicase/nuclease subunit A